MIYGLKFGYANGLFKLKQISLDSGDILSQKYNTRAYLKSNINSTLVNHDVNNVHYSATKSLLLKFYFLYYDIDFVGWGRIVKSQPEKNLKLVKYLKIFGLWDGMH